jgi:hypothetical protein
MSYTVRHKGNGEFEAIMDNGEIKEVGPNIQGMIRYTFFEDFSLPPINWEVTQKELLETYQPKVMKDITEGKIKPGKHEFGVTDWIEVTNMVRTIKTQQELEEYQKEVRNRQYEKNPVIVSFSDDWDNMEPYNFDIEYIEVTRTNNHEIIERIKY